LHPLVNAECRCPMMRVCSMKFMIKSLLLWEAVDYIMYMTYGMAFFIPSYPCIFFFQPLFCIIHTWIQPGNKSGYLEKEIQKNSKHWRALVGYTRNWVLLNFF
jgi:hypothetical protein